MGNEETTLNYNIKRSYDTSKLNYDIIIQQNKRIFRNKEDQIEQVEEYDVYYESQSYLEALKMMTILRSQLSHRLVKILYFVPQKNEICCSFNKAAVGIQRISKRLSDLKNHNLEKSMHLLHQALDGFQFLYEKYGLFQITPDMIGMNNNRQTKVWHNEDLVALFPQNYQCSSLQMMIQNIISMIQQRTQKNYQIPYFSEFLQNVDFQKYLRSFQTIKIGLQRYRQFYRLAPIINHSESFSTVISKQNNDTIPVHMLRQISFDFTGSSYLNINNLQIEEQNKVKQSKEIKRLQLNTKTNYSGKDWQATVCSSNQNKKLSITKIKNKMNQMMPASSDKINKHIKSQPSNYFNKTNKIKLNFEKQSGNRADNYRSTILQKNKSKKNSKNLESEIMRSQFEYKNMVYMKIFSLMRPVKFVNL